MGEKEIRQSNIVLLRHLPEKDHQKGEEGVCMCAHACVCLSVCLLSVEKGLISPMLTKLASDRFPKQLLEMGTQSQG